MRVCLHVRVHTFLKKKIAMNSKRALQNEPTLYMEDFINVYLDIYYKNSKRP